MTWFKIDDGFWSHPKILELSPEAVALWVRAGSYCAGHLTDGKVKRATLRVLAADRDAAVELVLAGLWEERGDGWEFHDWAEYQPTREQVLAERAAAAERKRRSRAASKSQPESHRDSRRESGFPDPTRPDPTPSISNEIEGGSPDGPSPHCKRHPDGSDLPCTGCRRAREKWDALQPKKLTPIPPRAGDTTGQCPHHTGYPLPCERCAREAADAA